MPILSVGNVARQLLFPERDFLDYLAAKSWKFNVLYMVVVGIYLVLAALDDNFVPLFWTSCSFTFRVVVLCSSRWSGKHFLPASTICVIVDLSCIIMAHTETQNTIWLPMYETLFGKEGPPCPICFPGLEGSWIFALVLSYMLMFVLPLRNAICVLPMCTGAYMSILVYARWNNYSSLEQNAVERMYGGTPQLEAQVRHLTIREITLFSATILANFAVKFVMQSSEFELWCALKDSRRTILKEKILRCEAEYANEQVKSLAAPAHRGDAASSYLQEDVGEPRAPLSAFSAPPILEGAELAIGNSSLVDACCHAGDCLPEDVVVWTRDNPNPTLVSRLVKGQQVLCYDHMGKCLKHAEVLNIVAQADTVQWATVTLGDGVSMRVTVDHPFLIEASSKLPSGQVPVLARDLKPYHDKVLVMKLVPVPVQSINVEPLEEGDHRTRISVDLHQPARHSIFVAPAGQTALESAMAVGASNLQVEAHGSFLPMRNTFIHFSESEPKLQRSNSAPDVLVRAKESVEETAPALHKSMYRVAKPPSPIPSGSSESKKSSERSSTASADGCQVRLGTLQRPVQDSAGNITDVVVVPNGESRIGLQDYMCLQRSSLPSLGSFHHVDGACQRICWFANQQQHGRSKKCLAGPFCDHCHLDHSLLRRSRRRASQGPDTLRL